MIYLKRLSEHTIYTGVLPWDFKPATPIPEEVRSDKKARHAWINHPGTDHHVYTLVEGVNVNLRITKPKADGEGNPPTLLHGLVADYDHASDEASVRKFASALSIVPNWIERTLSGHWRYVWLFEKPIRLASFSFATHFLKTFPEFAFDPARGMMGFDKPAWEAPERYWTNGCEWWAMNTEPISADLTEGWLVKAASTFEYSQKEFGASIPLEVIKPALAEKYPEFAGWPGEFTLGSHGPTFWVPASKSPMSATVYENGLRTFSENATKTFFSWADLLGIDFIRKHQAETAGAAARDIYFDGKTYFRLFADNVWRAESETVIARHLVVNRGASKRVTKDVPISTLDTTLDFITTQNRVDAALPAIFFPSGPTFVGGRRILNTSSLKVLTPAEGPVVWGPTSQFPWISKFLDELFDTQQSGVLKSWVQWAYQNAYAQSPKSGQVLFIAGPAGIGKTFLARAILGRVFGGMAEGAPWLMGETTFNSEMFEAGLWVLDDGTPATDASKRLRFANVLKRIAANREFYFNEKFRSAGLATWIGRVCVTMNADEVSARLLPDLDLSNLDKCVILRTVEKCNWEFPTDDELNRELPFFCRWLLDTPIAEEFLGDARFGIKAFADPELFETAQQSSSTASFSELLTIWKDEYFKDHPKETDWIGLGSELFMLMINDPNRSRACGKLSPESCGRLLSSMRTKGIPWVQRGPHSTRGRQWRILKAEKE